MNDNITYSSAAGIRHREGRIEDWWGKKKGLVGWEITGVIPSGGIQSTGREFDSLLIFSSRWTLVIWVQMQVA